MLHARVPDEATDKKRLPPAFDMFSARIIQIALLGYLLMPTTCKRACGVGNVSNCIKRYLHSCLVARHQSITRFARLLAPFVQVCGVPSCRSYAGIMPRAPHARTKPPLLVYM